MMNTEPIRNFLALALCAAVSSTSLAAEIKWNGTSGNWSNPAIWDGGQVPGRNDTVSFPNGVRLTGTVKIDGDFEANSILVKQQDSSGEYPVTLSGSGSLSLIGDGSLVNQRRRLVIDGPQITAGGISVGNVLEVRNGTFRCGRLKSNRDGMVFSVVNGTVSIETLSQEHAGCVFSMTNSEVRIGSVSGTPEYCLSGGGFAVTNGGIKIASGVAEAHFDVDRFSLAGHFGATDKGTKVVFDRPVTIGAYANWSTSSTRDVDLAEIKFAGGVVFDTADVADGETAREIGIYNFKVGSMYDSVSVSGPGRTFLRLFAPSGGIVPPAKIGNLVVGESSTLEVHCNRLIAVKAANLSMAENAKIVCRPDKVSFEMESSNIDPTASLTADAEGINEARFLLWTDFSSDAKPRIVCSGNEAYSVLTAGPFAFIANGAKKTLGNATEWTGAGSDAYWSTAGNWNGEVPNSGGKVAYFLTDTKTEITNDSDRTVMRMYFNSNGAFAFFGKQLTLNSVYTNAEKSVVYNSGSLPVAIYNTLNRGNTKATGLSFVSASRAFLALMGDIPLENRIFRFSGDVRVGGTVNCANIIFDPTWNSEKNSSCTILSGGEIVATAQSEIQKFGTGYDIRPGGVLDVLGGVWEWSVPVTNHIDGTLKLAARFGLGSVACFSGRGGIVLGGDALDGAGSEAEVSGSNTVSFASNATLGKWTVVRGATLTLDSEGNTLTFTEPVAGEGRLAFAPGTRAALGGDLLAASLEPEGAVISAAAETVGELLWPENYSVYCDGGSYRVKRRRGLSLSIR